MAMEARMSTEETIVRVVAVDWDERRARRLARALGGGRAVASVVGAAAAARELWARRPAAVLVAPGGPLDELGLLLDACAALRIPLLVCPPGGPEGPTLELLV